MWLLSTLLAMGSAQGAQILYWDYDDYPFEASAVGVDGWETGYEEDIWYGYEFDGYGPVVLPTTDDNGGSFGSGEAADNWLVNRDIYLDDAWSQVDAYTQDDDTLGLVFNFQDSENYYGFWLIGTRSGGGDGTNASNPLDEDSSSVRSVLVKIQDGEATILAEEGVSYARDTRMKIAAGENDGRVWGKLWVEHDQAWSDFDVGIGYSDADPFGPGAVGFYTYDAGGIVEGESLTLFTGIEVYAYDDDGDGVIDDEDNCEDVANEDQADLDGDGIGSECDDDEGEDDEGGDESGSSDDGSDESGDAGSDEGEGGDDGGVDTGGGVDTADDLADTGTGLSLGGERGTAPGGDLSACGCSGAGGAAGGVLLALLGVLGRRRRVG
jgi:uncharacterized protein (TIGR03382 family)